MGMTMTQKILAAHAGLPSVSAGQLIEADLDLVLGNDITSPVAIHEMDKMKVDGVFDKDKTFLRQQCMLYSHLSYIKIICNIMPACKLSDAFTMLCRFDILIRHEVI